MAKIRSKRTKPELRVHGHLKGNHVRHHMWPIMWGSPDVLVHPNTIVFVNGCFWHGCPKHFRTPKTNSLFWAGKIRKNRVRQDRVVACYKYSGYKVVVVWEHDLKGARLERIISKIAGRKKP